MNQPINSATVRALLSDTPLGVDEVLARLGADKTETNVKKVRNAFTNLKASGRAQSASPGRYVYNRDASAPPTVPRAKPARNGRGETADDLFVKVGKATQTLFPKGVPYDRIIEVAKLQETMLEVLTR